MRSLMSVLLCLSMSFAVTLYDDFSTGFEGWTARCGPAYWSCSEGQVYCQTDNTCSALVFPGAVFTQDGSISVYGSGGHVFGVVARLDNLNTGVYAYVSVDHNVARIRKVANGVTSTVYNSLYHDFPYGDYLLVLHCEGPDMTLSIEHIQTSQTWLLSAYSESSVQTGEWGLAAGETEAMWDWVELQDSEATGEEASSPLPQPTFRPQQNPFTGGVLITVENISPGVSLDVFDLSGRAVQSLDVSSGTAMFTPELPGVYLARLSGEADAEVVKLVCLP